MGMRYVQKRNVYCYLAIKFRQDDRDSLDDVALEDSKSSDDSSDSLEVEMSKPKYEVAENQQEAGTSLQEEEEEEEDFDKPHFHYDYDETDTTAEVSGNQLIATQNSDAPGGDLFDISFPNNSTSNEGPLLGGFTESSNVNQASALDSALFGSSASKSGDILLLDPLTTDPPPQSDPNPNSSVDLLNGFGDVTSAKSEKLTDNFDVAAKTPPTNADPFGIFGTAAPVTTESNSEKTSKDPFDLFLQ